MAIGAFQATLHREIRGFSVIRAHIKCLSEVRRGSGFMGFPCMREEEIFVAKGGMVSCSWNVRGWLFRHSFL